MCIVFVSTFIKCLISIQKEKLLDDCGRWRIRWKDNLRTKASLGISWSARARAWVPFIIFIIIITFHLRLHHHHHHTQVPRFRGKQAGVASMRLHHCPSTGSCHQWLPLRCISLLHPCLSILSRMIMTTMMMHCRRWSSSWFTIFTTFSCTLSILSRRKSADGLISYFGSAHTEHYELRKV